MPQYAVAQDPEIRTRVRPRRVKTPDEEAVLPTSKLPDAVAVAPRYNVSPQHGGDDPLVSQFASLLSSALQPQTPAPVAPMAAPAPEVPTLAQPVEADDPATSGLKRAADALQTAKDKPIEKNSRLKSFLKMAAYALGQSKPGKDWADVAMQAGQGLGGGIGGAIQPDAPGIMKKNYEVREAEGNLATAEKYANTVSLTDRRADQTTIAKDRLGLAAQKAALDGEYKQWLIKNGDRTATRQENALRFLQESRIAQRTSRESHEEWFRGIEEDKLDLAKQRFKADDFIKRGNLDVNRARARTYDRLVTEQITGKAADIAADEAEGHALLVLAGKFDTQVGKLDPEDDDDYDEITTLKKASIEARAKGEAKIAGARAAGSVKTQSAQPVKSAKPKSDPLGIFR